MDKKTLVDKDISEGANLVALLDQKKIDVSSAFWFFKSEEEEWRLILASLMVDSVGKKKTYGKIFSILKGDNEISLPTEIITVISPSDPLNLLLKRAIKTEKTISGIRFTNNIINGFLFKDSYLYRVL